MTGPFLWGCVNSILNVKALVGAFNQEKALVGAFSVVVEPMEHYTANHLVTINLHISLQSRLCTQLRTTRASRVFRNLVSPEAVFTWQTNILCQRRHQREFRCN